MTRAATTDQKSTAQPGKRPGMAGETSVSTSGHGTNAERIKATADAYTGSAEVAARLENDVRSLVLSALAEDLGARTAANSPETLAQLLDGDITTASIVPPDARAQAVMLAKAAGVIAGIDIAAEVFRMLDPTIEIELLAKDGAEITAPPQPIARFKGNARAILVAERTALNLIQRMSGIATVARRFAERAAEFGIAIVDTRKTTPGMRTLEKYAVKLGGAANHRYGLFDAILIKDNHICVAGGIVAAVDRARAAHPDKPVEVEVANKIEVEQALAAGAEKIMLDNMTADQIREAVTIIGGKALIEVSGGVSWDNLDDYLISGVDAISVGALTHSVRSLDISLDIEV
jgi:nicotinate-nucleotide pyrophosphorylase (carboxylating)